MQEKQLEQQYDLVLEPGRTIQNYWKDLWKFRELFYFLAWRDILVRYKQTVMGVAWAVLRPFLTMVVLTIVFGSIAKLPSDGRTPYAILVFAAMLPWQLFANAVSETSESLLSNSSMISKIYFPRLIIPTSAVIVGVIDFFISFALLGAMMVWFEFIPSWRIVFLPFFLLLALITALGVGYWLAAMNVKYRDFRYVVPFMVQFGLYISPVGFSSHVIPDKWKLLYSVNPMVGVIDGFRWSILGEGSVLYWPGFVLSVCLSLTIFVVGVSYFRKVERFFADVI